MFDEGLMILFMRGNPLFIYKIYKFLAKMADTYFRLAFLHMSDAKNKKLSGLSLLLADTLTIYFTK